VKRGDVVIVREPGTPAAKVRPCVVVTRESAMPHTSKLTICPLTSTLKGVEGGRPFVAPADGNGLRAPSEVQVDWIFTLKVDQIGRQIGYLDGATMSEVDVAIRNWLAL
jgi:mRNA interferase MazF